MELSVLSSPSLVTSVCSRSYKLSPLFRSSTPTCKSSELRLKCSQMLRSGCLRNSGGASKSDISSTKRYRVNLTRNCSQVESDETYSKRNILNQVESDETYSKRNILSFAGATWKFLRPHTIWGTISASCAIFGRGLLENPNLIGWSLAFKALSGLFALICANGYIVGINQIYDVGIDKVNKPDLPIAAGEISLESAWLLIVFFAVAGLSTIAGLSCGPFITALYCLSLFMGSMYSVPPFRFKKYPIAAFLIIAAVRGFLLNFGIYYASRATLGLPFQLSPPVIFITTFVTVFALAIAITKDLPDVEGDRKFKIPTFATKVGVGNIAYIGSGLLLFNYVASILVSIYMPQAFNRSFMIPMHTILASTLIYQTWLLEQANYTKEASARFYRFIWKLFYAEYMIFPFI